MPHPRPLLLVLPLALMFAVVPSRAASPDTPPSAAGAAAPVAGITHASPDDAAATAKVDALSPEVKRSIEEAARSLLQVQENDVELACDKGVENTRWSIETMLEVGQRNVDSGHLARSEYEPTAARLRALLDGVSMQDCETANGAKRAFYACMSSDYNHALACADAHRF